MHPPGNRQPTPAEDDEFLAGEALSPTDGYFNAMPPVPQQHMVPDPEQENTPAAKEREAREAEEERIRRHAQRQATAGPSSRRYHSPAGSSIVSASSRRSVDTSTDEADYPPPVSRRPRLPTYDDAIAERPYAGPPLPYMNRRSYNTMGPSAGRPEMEERLPQNEGGSSQQQREEATESQPLLFGDDLGDDQEAGRRGGGGNGWIKRWKRRLAMRKGRRGFMLPKLLLLLLVVCAIISFARLIALVVPRRNEHPNPHAPGSGRGPTQPADEVPPSASEFCKNWDAALTWSYDYVDLDDIHFVQVGTDSGFWGSWFPGWSSGEKIRQGGEIRLVKANRRADNEELMHGLVIRLDVYASHPELVKLVSFESRLESTAGIAIYKTPKIYHGEFGTLHDPCIYSVAHVMVASGTNVSRLEIGADFMDLRVHDSVDFGAGSKELNISLASGDIVFPDSSKAVSGIKQREIRINAMSGLINGTFPLYDLLDLSTISGRINTKVQPKEIDPFNPKPAKLSVESVSGNVHVAESVIGKVKNLTSTSAEDKVPAHDGGAASSIPARDYRTLISTSSGSINAELLHGSRTTIKTSSGHIQLRLAPYGDQDRKSSIDISITSGSLDFLLSKCISDSSAIIGNLDMNAQASVGSLRLEFPDTWEGSVKGTAISGPMLVDWPAFHRDSDDGSGRFPFNTILGHVGNGSSFLRASTISGMIHLIGGNETRVG